jgi:hypothetical protein
MGERSTAIHLRTVIEVAMDDHASGVPIDDITQFWRVVEPGSALARKVEGASDVARAQRRVEGIPDP